jgi:N-acetylmuramoyl-L-alanine amidase
MKIIDIIDDLPRGPKPYKRRSLSLIDTIVLHHSATLSGTPLAFATYHVKNNGWPGIGYHYVVGKKGEVWQTNYASTIGYHASGYNSRSIGICMVGNFDEQEFTGRQKAACLALMRYLLDLHHGIRRVLGHRETGSPKTCPGRKVDMDEIRKMLGVG